MKKDYKNLNKIQKIVLTLLVLINSSACSKKNTLDEELQFKNDFDERSIKASNIEQLDIMNQTELSQMMQIKKFLEEHGTNE